MPGRGRGRPFKPGQSGNPKGRPPNQRVLTEILRMGAWENAGADGSDITRQQAMADMIWKAALEGRVTLPDGRTLVVKKIEQWMQIVDWLYNRVDGPPKAEVGVDLGGQVTVLWNIPAPEPLQSES